MNPRIDYPTISPVGIKAYASVANYIAQCGLEDVLIELVNLRVSQINGCAFCLDMHTRLLIKKGVSPIKLALVQAWHETGDLFNARERAALAWAESVTRIAETHVSDTLFQTTSTVFTEKELTDLTMAIGLINAYNRLAISFRSPPQEATL